MELTITPTKDQSKIKMFSVLKQFHKATENDSPLKKKISLHSTFQKL